jgi:hypothetical protein
VGRGECGHEIYDIPGAESAVLLEGDDEPTEMGEGGLEPGGVYDHGTRDMGTAP